jgi:acyl dehydratase
MSAAPGQESMNATAERELERSPSIAALFLRAGIGSVPGASRLPFLASGDGQRRALTLDAGQIDRDRLVSYERVCGFPVGDTLPATYLHVLAFPLHLTLLTDGSLPFAAIGLVHIANRIVQHRPIGAGERLTLRVWLTDPEPHPRGVQFSLCSQAHVGSELVWEEVSTNLSRGGGDPDTPAPPGPPGPPGPPSSSELPATATWRLRGDLGRRYAAVSKDFNPIHIHALTARAFGFKSAIAHGMWTKARCLAALGPEVPDACSIEVAFKRPILLPSVVKFAEQRDGDQIRFGVRDAKRDRSHLDGVLRP